MLSRRHVALAKTRSARKHNQYDDKLYSPEQTACDALDFSMPTIRKPHENKHHLPNLYFFLQVRRAQLTQGAKKKKARKLT